MTTLKTAPLREPALRSRLGNVLTLALLSLAACPGIANAQGQAIDWPSYGGDAQRTGWEKSDSRITKENIKDFQLVLKRKLDNGRTGPYALTPPVMIGRLISYRGFKELAFVTGSSGKVWSIDVDMDRIFWQKQLDAAAGPKTADSACSDRATAVPALTPPLNFARRRTGRPAATPAAPPTAGTQTIFAGRHPLFVLAGDGKLHQLNTSDGSDQFPALNFLPPEAKASSLLVHDGVLYTTTIAGCGGAPGGVWALDLNDAAPKPVSYVPKSGTMSGLGGFAMGADGTIYVQTGADQSGTLLALNAKDLKLKQSFVGQGSGSVTPVVFTWKDREMVISAGKNGRLYLLDAQSLGGDDHKTALFETAPISEAGVWGGLSSWEDAEGIRWVLASVWGPTHSELKAFLTNGPAPTGSVVAFKVEDHDGKPVLTPAWVSRDMQSPEPPVITSGVAFALAAGASTHATLYALDATTGKEMYSTGTQVTAPASLTGLTVANGRVYFTTTDNTLYAFGVYLER
ncbi:MAG: PQQ-binding-like beta-propeller repeat protein [Acidobacteriota bacterium]|nr:PQQ-binding-like beta-propeller repeat protein [Acidobacteriota bacterium]